MNCEPFYYSGLSDCDMLFKDVIGVMVFDKNQALSAPAELATYEAIFANITAITGVYLPINRGYQNNTAEPTLNTSQVGFTEKVNDPMPQLVGFLTKSYCDYKTLWGLDGRDMDVVLVLKNGKIWHTVNTSGYNVGFRARINIRKNAPGADDSVENYPIYINFLYVDDLDEAKITTLNFSIKEFETVTPVGLSISQVVAYASGVGDGTITVDVTKRCTRTPFTSVTAAANFKILGTEPGSTDLDVSVTTLDKTSAAIGRYILTVKKDSSGTPANLTKGVYIQLIEDNSTKVTYLSDPFFIKV